MTQDNIVLIGYRAVGKSTVGALLAQRLGRTWVDLDTAFEAAAGESIATFVAREGWPAFRQQEKALVQHYAQARGLVLATGGGVILDPENVACLKASGIVIWLQATPQTIQTRLSQDQQQTAARPGLTGKGTVAEVGEVLASREPLYRAAADYTISVDTLSPMAVVEEIMQLLEVQENQQP